MCRYQIMEKSKYQPKYQIGDIEKSLQALREQLLNANLSEEHLELTYKNLETLEALIQYKLVQIRTMITNA